jgi:hypothetical protein
VEKINTVLLDISAAAIAAELVDQIQDVATLAASIGLQFGVQPSQLRLSIPNREQVIEIGDEFHDCMDGDADKGARVSVDLVVSPGLLRIGDGRRDLRTKVPIVPCDFYPLAG